MNLRKPVRILVIMITLAAVVLTACSGDKDNKKEETVSVQLNWTNDHAWSGFYMAQTKHHYEDENLDVDLRLVFDADGNYIDPREAVASGQADFGIAEGGELLQARADGKPLVAIATLYQRHPLALVSLADKGIVKPQDLVGVRAQISGNNLVIFLALLKTQGIAPDDVTIIDRTDYTLQPLLDDEADVIDGWVTNEIVTLTEEGYDFNMILPLDYGVETYPNVIFTTEDTIKNKPDRVERFLRATLKGLQDAIADPQAAAQLAVDRDNSLDLNLQTKAMQRSIPLIVTAGSNLGMMTPETWKITYDMLNAQHMLNGQVDVNQAYTLDFLNAIYK